MILMMDIMGGYTSITGEGVFPARLFTTMGIRKGVGSFGDCMSMSMGIGVDTLALGHCYAGAG